MLLGKQSLGYRMREDKILWNNRLRFRNKYLSQCNINISSLYLKCFPLKSFFIKALRLNFYFWKSFNKTSLQAYNKKSVDLSSVFKEVLMKMAQTTKNRLSTAGKEKKKLLASISTLLFLIVSFQECMRMKETEASTHSQDSACFGRL